MRKSFKGVFGLMGSEAEDDATKKSQKLKKMKKQGSRRDQAKKKAADAAAFASATARTLKRRGSQTLTSFKTLLKKEKDQRERSESELPPEERGEIRRVLHHKRRSSRMDRRRSSGAFSSLSNYIDGFVDDDEDFDPYLRRRSSRSTITGSNSSKRLSMSSVGSTRSFGENSSRLEKPSFHISKSATLSRHSRSLSARTLKIQNQMEDGDTDSEEDEEERRYLEKRNSRHSIYL